MKKWFLNSPVFWSIIFVMVFTSCYDSISSKDKDLGDYPSKINIINNTTATITVYYAQEHAGNFCAYSENISAGASDFIVTANKDGLRDITVVRTGMITTYLFGVDFSDSITVSP